MTTELALLIIAVLMVGCLAVFLGVHGIYRWLNRPADSTQRLGPQIVMALGGVFIASLPWTWPTLQSGVGVFLS
jgi:hypothetical protein